jgi:DNA-binding transcriptional LysR family regulator
MELRKLEVFCKVVEMKSFTRSAEAVLLSQPTVSEHIRSLEEELGQKLLDRTGREVEPTPVGRLLYNYAVKILRLQQSAMQAIEQYGGKLVGRIMIGSGTIPGTYILPEIISRFRGRYPSIRATLKIAGSQLIASEVLNGQLEIGVVGARWNEKGLEWLEHFSDNLALVVHANIVGRPGEEVDLEELAGEPFILREPESGTRKVIDQIFEDHGMKTSSLTEVAEIGSTAAVLEAVRAGLGIAVLSARAVERDVRSGALAIVPIKGVRLERPFYMIRRKNRELSPAAAVFWDYLLKEGKAVHRLSGTFRMMRFRCRGDNIPLPTVCIRGCRLARPGRDRKKIPEDLRWEVLPGYVRLLWPKIRVSISTRGGGDDQDGQHGVLPGLPGYCVPSGHCCPAI